MYLYLFIGVAIIIDCDILPIVVTSFLEGQMKSFFILTLVMTTTVAGHAFALSCPEGTTMGVDCWGCDGTWGSTHCLASITTAADGHKVFNIEGNGESNNRYAMSPPYAWSEAIKDVTEINISGVTHLRDSYFKGASNVTTVNIPDSVISINEKAFSDTGLTSVNFGDNPQVKYLGFSGVPGLTSIDLPDSVTSISSFYGTGLTSLELPNGLTSIGSLTGLPLKEIVIPDSVTSIGSSAFYHMKELEKITLPNNENFTTISNSLFNGASNLKEIIIPNTITKIGEYAFEDCASLESVTIPRSVTSIGRNAFDGLTNLKSLTFETDEDGKVGFTTIPFAAFMNSVSSLTTLKIPEGVTTIESGAFEGASNLTTIILPDSVTDIRGGAFRYSSKITDVFCHDTGDGRCENFTKKGLWGGSSSLLLDIIKPNTLKLYTVDDDGVYVVKDYLGNLSYYASIDDMLKGASGACESQAACKAIVSANNSAASGSAQTGNRMRKRIYTVEEASRVSKDTGNRIMLRYR